MEFILLLASKFAVGQRVPHAAQLAGLHVAALRPVS